jgi:putative ABC transport system permease protein
VNTPLRFLRPRWRKVLLDLWDNKLRTLLVVFSIAIGVFAVGMIAGAYIIIQTDMSASYASANPANVELRTEAFTQEVVDSLKNIPGIRQVEGRRMVSIQARIPGGDWVSLDLAALDDYENQEINLLKPYSGSSIPGERELVLELGAIEDLPVGVGDSIEVKLPDGSSKLLPLAGIVQDQTTAAGDFMAAPLGFVSFDTLTWLKYPASFNRLYATVLDQPDNEAYIRQAAKDLTDKFEKNGLSVYRTRISLRTQHPMESTVQAILGVLGALGILVVLLSSSLIANTLNALLNQHLRHIGVMKLVGARNHQVIGMYIVLILAFGILALLIAVPLGGQAAYLFSDFIANQLNFSLLGYRVVPVAALLQIAIGLIVPLGAGIIPVLNGARTTVLHAISGDTTMDTVSEQAQKGKSGRLQRFVARLPRPLLLSWRNTFRRKGRLALTLFTLTMGGAIFIAVFNVRVTLNQFIDQIGNYFLADVTLSFVQPYRLSEIEGIAMQVPGVVSIEGWAFASGEALYADGSAADSIIIMAPPADSTLVDPILVGGRWLVAGDRKAITVSDAVRNKFPGLQPGDRLRLKINGREDDWTIVGFFNFVDREGLIADANYDYIAHMTNLPRQSVSFRIVTERHDPDFQKQMSIAIDRHFRERGYKVSETEPGRAALKVAIEGLGVLVTFLLIMALLTASVGSMGLTGTMGMNVLERTREIGIMRSIGAVDFEIIKSVVIEGTVIGIISWILGAILSFPFSALLSYIVSIAIFNTPLTPKFTIEGFAIWLGLVIVLSALASGLPARNAARLTIREVLAYE